MEGLIQELQGKWVVDCHGVAAPMDLIGDQKIITDITGHNVMGGKEWGWFSIEQVEADVLMLNYADTRNSTILQSVCDYIMPDGAGWFGEFYLAGCPVFTFNLDRVQ